MNNLDQMVSDTSLVCPFTRSKTEATNSSKVLCLCIHMVFFMFA